MNVPLLCVIYNSHKSTFLRDVFTTTAFMSPRKQAASSVLDTAAFLKVLRDFRLKMYGELIFVISICILIQK